MNDVLDEVKQQLLGPLEYEARIGCPLDGWSPRLPQGVELRARGDDWLRFRIAQPAKMNPVLLRQLLNEDLPVVAFHEVPRSLENAFLNALERAEE